MYSRIVNWINNMRLRTKFIVSFGCVALIPVLIIGIFLTSELREMAMNNALEQVTANVDRVKKRTGEMLNVSLDISYRLSNDSRLGEAANRRYESVYEVVKAYWEYRDFRDFVSLYSNEISSIRLYVDNPTIIENWEFLQENEKIVQEPWYKTAMAQRNMAIWMYIPDTRDGRYNLSLVRRVDFLKQRTSGVLVLNVNIAKLNEILNQEAFETLIVDEHNYIVASNRQGMTGKLVSDMNWKIPAPIPLQGLHKVTIDGKPFQMMIDNWQPGSSLNSLRIISLFSVASIVDEPNRIMLLAAVVILAAFLIATLLITFFSKLLSGRILSLSKNISKVASGNLAATVVIDGKDEIGHLARQFNNMVWNINSLMSEVQESNRQKNAIESRQNEIKFKMMASQINPHFLFNALEAIRMKAYVRGQSEIAQIVHLLGKLMRKNLEVGNNLIPVKSELDTVECYLMIQKFRYEDRLSYEIQVDPQAYSVRIPPLIIQPLIENSVIHGLENKVDGGNIRIDISTDNGQLLVQVSDNGIGFTRERLEEIQRLLEDKDETDSSHIGLRNIHSRLQLSFGATSGLTLASQYGYGTQISFAIPLRRQEHV